MLLPGAFGLFFAVVLLLAVVPMVFWLIALIEVARAPEPAFGPPWDNSKNAWLVGMAVASIIPAGMIVAPILWWSQGRTPLRTGASVPRPFWAGRPAYPPQPYPPQPTYAPPQPPVPPGE